MNPIFKFCLILVSFVCSMVHADYQRIIEDYSNYNIGQELGEVLVYGSAQASDPKVQAGDDGARYIEFDFKCGPSALESYDASMGIGDIDSANIIEAEDGTLYGVDVYDDPNASGGKAVAGFGDPTHDPDYIEFTEVPPSHQLIIYYTNGSGQTNNCGLYVNNERVATLELPDTGGWQSEYKPFVYNGYVQGSVKLKSDAEDLTHNQSFCCIVDRIALSKVIPDTGKIDIKLPLSPGSLKSDDHSISFLVKTNEIPFMVILEDYDGNLYRSVKFHEIDHAYKHIDPSSWERFTVLLNDFEPAVSPRVASKIKTVHFELEKTLDSIAGNFAVREILVSRGWPSTVPADSPLEQSSDYKGISFTGRHAEYTEADTWYPSWAEDGNMYSPYTDGRVNGLFSRSDTLAATTGMAIIKGDDPLNLNVRTLGLYTSRPVPLGTRYPCGTLVHDGVWYYGTYNIGFPGDPEITLGAMGPFVGFRYSTDYGKSWTETPCTPMDNLFGVKVDPQGKSLSSPVRIGAPHIVDFGKNMQHSPDGKAYMVGHGTSVIDDYSAFTWTMGNEINIARVSPSPENMNDISQYEFFAGFDPQGEPNWTNKIADMKPVIDWTSHTGCVTATYNAVLKKYFMCVTTAQRNVYEAFDTYILEADRIEGPYRMVCYMEDFGLQAYFVNIPSKFISEDGQTMWLCYSANYTSQSSTPRHSKYALSLREFRLMDK